MILKLKNLFSDITGETKNKYKGPCQILFKIPFCLIYWAQLFEGRLTLNPGLNLTEISFSFVQKNFFG